MGKRTKKTKKTETVEAAVVVVIKKKKNKKKKKRERDELVGQLHEITSKKQKMEKLFKPNLKLNQKIKIPDLQQFVVSSLLHTEIPSWMSMQVSSLNSKSEKDYRIDKQLKVPISVLQLIRKVVVISVGALDSEIFSMFSEQFSTLSNSFIKFVHIDIEY